MQQYPYGSYKYIFNLTSLYIEIPIALTLIPSFKLKARSFEQAFSTTYGTRTRDSSVKGRRLNLLTNAAFILTGRQR